MKRETFTYELTKEQIDIIQIAVEVWAEDQEMMYEDGDHEDPELWEEWREILNDNFPFWLGQFKNPPYLYTMKNKHYEPNQMIDYTYVDLTLYLGDVKHLYRHILMVNGISPNKDLMKIADKLKMVIDDEMFEMNLVK